MATNNAFAAFVQGRQAGQQARAFEQEQQDRNALRTLAPQVLAGDPAAFDQAAAIDPQAAVAYQGAGDTQLRRLKGALDYFDQGLKSGDDRLIQARFKEISPFLSRVTGNEAPPAWTAEMAPAFEQAKTRVAMLAKPAGEADPAGYRQFELMAQAAGLQPGTPEYIQAAKISLGQEGRASSGGYSFNTIDIGDGRPRQLRQNPRTGGQEYYDERYQQWVPLGAGAGGPAAPPAPSATQPANASPSDDASVAQRAQAYHQRMTGLGLSDEQAMAATEAYLADLGYQQRGDGGTPEAGPQTAPPGIGAGRTKEEEAGAAERARLQAQMEYLPAELAMRGQAAVDQAVGIDQGKAAAERAAAAPGTIATLQGSVDSINQLLNSRELGSIVGLGSLNPINRIPGTEARGLIARADQIAGQAFLAAFNQLKGGGAITEKEGDAATRAMARLDRSQSEADYRRALTDLRDAITPSIERARQQASPSSNAAPATTARRARNPQTGEMLILRNGQWVPEDGR